MVLTAAVVGAWIVLLIVVAVVAALVRQVGLIHVRIPPAGARMSHSGPALGERVPAIAHQDVAGRTATLGSARGRQTLITFVSSACGACDDIAPALHSLLASESGTTDLILVSDGPIGALSEFRERHGLQAIPAIANQDLREAYGIMGFPHAVLVDRDERVVSKGMVNNLEHFESLFRAVETQFPNIEAFMDATLVPGPRMEEGMTHEH